ncbi:aminopeptidase [Chryseosolibacter indicus]|uniref:Aminopeptidase n=1 Tax=Chryseosolibacter indicus TaxID=2782351 RepID=A0ABS5VT09_9BACT|nr:aminopeptidase [Chryseosolibacter indicus]MBT1704168.1 aminopeptidase [Chryseosolibacter indicus]
MAGKTWKFIKRLLLALLLVILVLVAAYWDLVVYGLRQAKGQLNIVWNARPVEEFLKDPQFPDSLKAKLVLINEVRKYAIDSLGLKDTKNYKTLYDQKGEEIMWVVTASEQFRLKAKEWEFPVLGAVPYKGFFNRELAIELGEELKKEGWDVSIRNPGGWSTLGWFTDPILSKMLERSEGDLANLIIHEMSHATIFVKDSIDYNENLATFIGDRGTEKFLISKYGEHAKEYQLYINENEDYLKFSDHMLRGSEKLDSLYKTMNENDSVSHKLALKTDMIKRIVSTLDTLTLSTAGPKPSSRYKERLPNNAYFMNFRRYQAKQDTFWEEWEQKFNSDLKSYIKYLSEKHPFL